MKRPILCLSFLALAIGLSAQYSEADIRRATDEAVAFYQLNESQAEEMYVIQERRFRNLASIEELRQSDEGLYYQKKNSIREGMMASTKRLLNEQQMEVYNQQLVERRRKETAVKAKLKDEGATREEIQIALWKLE